MHKNRISPAASPVIRRPCRSFHPSPRSLFLLAAIVLAAPRLAQAQQTETPPDPDPAPNIASSLDAAIPAPASELAVVSIPATPAVDFLGIADSSAQGSQTPTPLKPKKHTPESELAVEGMVSYGNWQIFAAGIWEHLYTAGFEYDRHSWGQFAGAQMDYAADFTPLVLLREPATLNPYGIRRSKPGDYVTLHGLAFSPIGLRMEWRPEKKFKPYFTVLGGAIGFTKKALSPDASYYDFTLHESVGFYLQMSQRVDMRFGLFGDFHFSNAYATSYNPGLDNMNSQLAVSYHFGG